MDQIERLAKEKSNRSQTLKLRFFLSEGNSDWNSLERRGSDVTPPVSGHPAVISHAGADSPWENGLPRGVGSVHLKERPTRTSAIFRGVGQRAVGESAGIYAADWYDAISVCTPEGYHEHFAGELALLAEWRISRIPTRVPLGPRLGTEDYARGL